MIYSHEQFGKIRYYIQGVEIVHLGPNNFCRIKVYAKVASYISFIRNIYINEMGNN